MLKKSTIKEVAKLAKVGTTSVTRYFHNPKSVSISLKKRILKATNKLSYFPNPIASSLASRRTKIIPVYIPSIRYAIIHFMRGIEKVLHDSGFQTLISTNDGNLISELSVGINHKAVGVEMAKFIIKKKYKHISFIGTDLTNNDLHTSQIYSGFKNELLKKKIIIKNLINFSEKEKDKLYYGGKSISSEAIKKIIKKNKKTDIAIFADDIFALDAHIYCKKININMPKDLSLATFGTTFTEIKEVSPSFTSIDMNFLQVGQKSGEIILKKIYNKKVNKINEINHFFVEGGTTK